MTINSLSSDPVKSIQDFTHGKGGEVLVDLVIIVKQASTVIEVLKKKGRYIMVGHLGIIRIKSASFHLELSL